MLLTFSKAGELPMSKIGERLMVHPTSVTNTVDRLVGAGLVDKRPNPNDGRGTLASITDKGREVVEAATRDLMAMDFGLGAYDDEECGEIFALLRPLRIAAGDFDEELTARGAPGAEASSAQGRVPSRHEEERPDPLPRDGLRHRCPADPPDDRLIAKYLLDIDGARRFIARRRHRARLAVRRLPGLRLRPGHQGQDGRSASCCGSCWPAPFPPRRSSSSGGSPASWSRRFEERGRAGRCVNATRSRHVSGGRPAIDI